MNPTGKNHRPRKLWSELSRQRRSTILRQMAGLCVRCGKPRGDGTKQHCRGCADIWNKYQRTGPINHQREAMSKPC